MYQKLVEPPEHEPISVGEAKHHLRMIHSDYDNRFIGNLITAARQWCENYQNRAYLTQKWRLIFDRKISQPIDIPRPPLQSIESLTLIDDDGIETEVTDYIVDDSSDRARLKVESYPSASMREIGGFQIDYLAGSTIEKHETTQTVKENSWSVGEFIALENQNYDNSEPDVLSVTGSNEGELTETSEWYTFQRRIVWGIEIEDTVSEDQDIEIEYEYENHDVSERVKTAIKLIVGHWYEHREAVKMNELPYTVNMAVESLLSQDRVMPA